jgi:hypothetical protein
LAEAEVDVHAGEGFDVRGLVKSANVHWFKADVADQPGDCFFASSSSPQKTKFAGGFNCAAFSKIDAKKALNAFATFAPGASSAT